MIDGEHEVGNLAAADGWGSENITEAKMLEVANIRGGAAREDEGETPEEPLERDQGGGGDGEVDQGQS